MRLALLVIAVLLVAACRQGAGEPCQITADCDDGLVCVLPAGAMLSNGLVCMPLPTDAGVDLTPPPPPADMSMPPVDASAADSAAAVDATAPDDLATVDVATAPDLAGHD